MTTVPAKDHADYLAFDDEASTSAARNERVVGAIVTPTEQGTSAPGAVDLAPGTMVGEYRIESKIGQGGIGAVYSAIHPLIAKTVAIKILPKARCTSALLVRRFIDEARVVNQIDHPNIVDIFGFGELAGSLYLVMERLRGETLHQRLKRGPLSLRETCAIVKPLTFALEAAHAKGVVHRDIKPDNIFLVDAGKEPPVVKLLDFGIAKLLDRDSYQQTFSGKPLGTPAYLAPEIAAGHGATPSVDLYSLGTTMFQMLVGRPPFIAATPFDVLQMHISAQPPALSSFIAVPLELDRIVLAMLAKHPEVRPTITEVRVVVDRLLAQIAAAPSETRPAVTIRRWLVASVLAASAVVGVIVSATTANTAAIPSDAGSRAALSAITIDASRPTDAPAMPSSDDQTAPVATSASTPATLPPAAPTKVRGSIRRPRRTVTADPPQPTDRVPDDMLMPPDPNRPHTRPDR